MGRRRTAKRITKRMVDALQAPTSDKRKIYDDALTGFGVVVYASGKKSFFIEYGSKGQRKRMTIGRYGPLTVEEARSLAIAHLGRVTTGEDPLDARNEERVAVSVEAWIDRYLDGVRKTKKQPRHDVRYLAMAKQRWGPQPLAKLKGGDVHAEMQVIAKRGHTTANRWLASVRACFGAAVALGVIETNPAVGVKAFREGPPRDRVLSHEELAALLAEMAKVADPHVRAAFFLLVETGARKSEVLNARWADFDLDAGIWRLPSTKRGHPQLVPLINHTVDRLRATPPLGPWLVPGRDPSQHRYDLKGPWKKLCAAANIEGATIHDIRRTYGHNTAQTVGLQVTSRLLRHSDIRVTERVYVPLGLDAMRDASAEAYRLQREAMAQSIEKNNKT